eukprot:6196641-Pleurochrysis_carterae.AAC.4
MDIVRGKKQGKGEGANGMSEKGRQHVCFDRADERVRSQERAREREPSPSPFGSRFMLKQSETAKYSDAYLRDKAQNGQMEASMQVSNDQLEHRQEVCVLGHISLLASSACGATRCSSEAGRQKAPPVKCQK